MFFASYFLFVKKKMFYVIERTLQILIMHGKEIVQSFISVNVMIKHAF